MESVRLSREAAWPFGTFAVARDDPDERTWCYVICFDDAEYAPPRDEVHGIADRVGSVIEAVERTYIRHRRQRILRSVGTPYATPPRRTGIVSLARALLHWAYHREVSFADPPADAVAGCGADRLRPDFERGPFEIVFERRR